MNKSSTILDHDPNYISYADIVKDPVDMRKVNAELVVDKYGNVVLSAIKDIMPGEEILISFGQLFWAYFLRERWNTRNEKMLESYSNVKKVYSLTDFFTRSIFNEYTMSNTISEKLDEFTLWELGTNHSLNNLRNSQNSCYMAALLQCIAHIPALSRLLLETDLCTNISDNTFLFNYMELLKVLINTNKQSKSDINNTSLFFKRNRNVIMMFIILKK